MQLVSSRAPLAPCSMRHRGHRQQQSLHASRLCRTQASLALDGAIPNDKPEEVSWLNHHPPAADSVKICHNIRSTRRRAAWRRGLIVPFVNVLKLQQGRFSVQQHSITAAASQRCSAAPRLPPSPFHYCLCWPSNMSICQSKQRFCCPAGCADRCCRAASGMEGRHEVHRSVSEQ